MTTTGNLQRRLRELLRERSVAHGDFMLASGHRSSVYIDARRTTMSGERFALIGTLGLARLAARGWASSPWWTGRRAAGQRWSRPAMPSKSSSPPWTWACDDRVRLVAEQARCMMLIDVHDHTAGGADPVTVQAGAADRASLASKIR